jgi:hypothetical protein
MHLALIDEPFVPHINSREPCYYAKKFQMASRLILLMSSGSKKKEPKNAYLSEAKSSHSQRMWAEVSSSAPHLLYNGLSYSPKCRCLLRVLCPVDEPGEHHVT